MVLCHDKNIRLCSNHFGKLKNIRNSFKGLGHLMRSFVSVRFTETQLQVGSA